MHKILADNLVVLYARSGLGKTFLLNAGLSQALRDRGFIPMMVRFNDPEIEPVQWIYAGIEEIAKQKSVEVEAGEDATLWQYFKTTFFWSGSNKMLTPVLMLDFLCKRREKGINKITDEVESFQLQLLCRYIEDMTREKTKKKSDEIIVKKEDLGGEAGMQRVLQRFYDDQMVRLVSWRQKEKVRSLCEKGLISITNRRLSLEEDEIKRRFKVSKVLLQELVNCRLLRAEPRVGSVYYELSHDTLVSRSVNRRESAKPNEEKLRSDFS